jgi:hypothetical protein
MLSGGQRESGFGRRVPEGLVAALRRKPLTANRAALIIASYSALCEVRGRFCRRRLSWALQAIITVGCRDVVAGTGA